LQNIHVQAVEENGKVVFLHKIQPGAADKSYGIHVAELAQLPKELISRANDILHSLERDISSERNLLSSTVEKIEVQEELSQLTFFTEGKEVVTNEEKEALEIMKELDILGITPLEAMNILYT